MFEILFLFFVVAEGGSGANFYQTGAYRQGLVRRSVQGYRQPDAADCGHQDNRS